MGLVSLHHISIFAEVFFKSGMTHPLDSDEPLSSSTAPIDFYHEVRVQYIFLKVGHSSPIRYNRHGRVRTGVPLYLGRLSIDISVEINLYIVSYSNHSFLYAQGCGHGGCGGHLCRNHQLTPWVGHCSYISQGTNGVGTGQTEEEAAAMSTYVIILKFASASFKLSSLFTVSSYVQ